MKVPDLDIKQAWVSHELPHDRQLYRAQFSPDGKFIAAAGQDKLVHLWQLDGDGAEKSELAGHRTWVSSLVFHPRCDRLFTADHHGVIHCWDYHHADRPPRWTIPDADHDTVRSMAITPDGQFLVSAGDDGVVKVWSGSDGKAVDRLEGHAECVFSLTITPDGKQLVSGDLLGRICQWSTSDGWELERELDATLLHTRGDDFLADVGGVRSLALSPDGHRLAAGGMKEAKSNAFCPGKPTVLIFDWGSGEQVAELGIEGESDGPINALRFLEDGTLVGHTERLHSESELAFWAPGHAAPLHSVKSHSSYDLSLHPDGRQLLAVSYVSGGNSGNGARGRTPEKYTPNRAALVVFSLFAKQA